MELKKPLKEEWGQKYYVYLRDKKKSTKLPKKLKNAKINFYDLEKVDDPVMVIKYEENGDTFSNVYYIKDDNVEPITYQKPTEIEFLYNIEDKDYDYYLHTKEENKDSYSKVSDKISGNSNKEEYTFTEKDKETVVDQKGKEFSISKYEETFVEVDEKKKEINYDTDLEEKELKEAIKKGINQYETQDDIVTDKVKKQVKKDIDDLSDRKKEMEKIEESSYNSGITNLTDALEYESGFPNHRYGNSTLKVGDMVFAKNFIHKKDVITPKDLTDAEILDFLYNYVQKKDGIDFYNKVYSEKEVKTMLKELFGKNYTYDHKLEVSDPQHHVCETLSYLKEKNGYSVIGGGCGGRLEPGTPYSQFRVVEVNAKTVVVGEIYIVPAKRGSTIESLAPYSIYSDPSKKAKIATINSDDDINDEDKIFDLIKEKGTRYTVTFDKDNGYYMSRMWINKSNDMLVNRKME